jgi:hypothetical protein
MVLLFPSFFLSFSYGILFGVGNAMVRETSSLMLSQYFKRKRELVEVFASAGTGVGVAVFTNVLHAGVGWVRDRIKGRVHGPVCEPFSPIVRMERQIF